MKALAQYVIQSRKQALFWCILFALVPLLGWIASALMAFVTLRKGAYEGLLLLASITVADIAYAQFFLGGLEARFVILDLLANNLPTFLAALYLRKAASWNTLIEGLTYITLLLILAIHLAFPDISQWWVQQLTGLSDKITDIAHTRMTPKLIQQAAYYATGLQAMLALGSILFNLVIARYLQASLFNPGGLKRELYFLHMPKRLGYLMMAVALPALLSFNLAKDLLPVTLIPFICTGISLFYDFASKRAHGWAWLISFYALLLLAFPSVCLILVIVGLLDTFVNLRPYLKTTKRH